MSIERVDQSSSFNEIKDLFSEACSYAFLPITMFSVCYNAIECFATSWIYKDDIQDKDGCTFQVVPQHFDALAELWAQRKVTFLEAAPDASATAKIKTGLKDIFRESLAKQYAIIQSLSQKTGIQADFYLEIEANSKNIGNRYAPYQAIGSRLGENTPIILFTPSQLNISSVLSPAESADSFIDRMKQAARSLEPAKEFLIAHEFSHLAHEDPLKFWQVKAISDVSTVAVWAIGFYASSGWISYLLGSYLVSTAIQAVGAIAQRALAKKQEARADVEAVKMLGSKKGAVEFLERIPKTSLDPYYPTPQERLRNVQLVAETP